MPFFLQLIQTDEPVNEMKKRRKKPIIEEVYSDDESNNSSSLFNESQQLEQAQNDNNNDIQCEDGSVDEGQSTPVAGSSKSVNIIQQQLNAALKILSPQEKITKMRIQAKSNAEKRRHKLKALSNKNKSKSETPTEKIYFSHF